MKTDTSEKGLEALIVGYMTADGAGSLESRKTTTAATRSI